LEKLEDWWSVLFLFCDYLLNSKLKQANKQRKLEFYNERNRLPLLELTEELLIMRHLHMVYLLKCYTMLFRALLSKS
jgi:hypothetical protein